MLQRLKLMRERHGLRYRLEGRGQRNVLNALLWTDHGGVTALEGPYRLEMLLDTLLVGRMFGLV